MKTVVYSPAALARLEDIADYTFEQFGEAQAEAYVRRLTLRVDTLAAGEGPAARPCGVLMGGDQEATNLCYYREGSHVLILRERADILDVVEIFHERMDIECHLRRLT
ncbi:type II toxin-antitoxin system RelE/ParE family toxin [Rhizobium sp. L1K21]|uniref:type II toxin-antitoxin system RelE/ParE family toxin n=1 Tax=Rhizobium sp. L1K21 TaxID=2954933 RepID=UPI002093DEBE|nr:type II toxin-antitoxin system RelE/ParE family toxin [Rhizobium sp. L1K21]